MRVVVYPDPDHLAEAAAAEITATLDGGRDRVTLGLSGGSTPRLTYQAMRHLTFDWDRVDLWLSDERWVPPDDERSNGAMVEATFASQIPARLHRPPYAEGMDPGEAASLYEQTLRRLFAGDHPDTVLLGMGADGHTASLFPSSAALAEHRRWYVANQIPGTGEWRLTATFPLLLAARRLFVLVTGAAKAATLAEVLEDDAPYPIRRLVEASERLTWLVDEAAATGLASTPVERLG